MPEIADPPPLCCYLLHSGTGIEESQSLAPDLFSPLARNAHARGRSGRFATGHSGNPAGRPPGIPNPKRRLPDLRARPLSPEALSDFLKRKPWLLRPLAAQFLPPARRIDPAERLGLDLGSLHTAEDFQRVLSSVLAAVSQGEIAPAEAARIARRVRSRLRALRRLQRLARRAARLANKTDPVRPPLG
jgi:hypothetical protein